MAYVTDSDLEATGVSQGANMVGFVQNDSGAVSRTTMEKLRETVSVLDFGATGNGTTDDYPAIQAALTWVGDHGGGTVFLPPTFSGRYRITQGLKIPSHVTLCGCAPARYPFNAGNLNSSALYADFGDPFQWIVEADTQDDNGDPIPYNVLLSSAQPLSRNITANICVKHLIITADPNKAIPYGGIRMHGCPGAIIEDVSVDIASCGALVNCCFDPRVSIHVQTPNYGLVVYDVNAGVFDLYAGGTDGGNKFVQAEYILPHMSLINGAIIPAFKLKTEDHYKRKWGLTIGSNNNASVGNTFNIRSIEQYSGCIFQRLSFATVFTNVYLEGGDGITDYGLVSTASHFTAMGLHAYLSGDGQLFDQGADVTAQCFVTGIPHTSFGDVYMETPSRLVVRLCNPLSFGPEHPQYNVSFPDFGWSLQPLTLEGGWTWAGDPFITTTYSINSAGEVCLAGAVMNGTAGTRIATLPQGYRPYKRHLFACAGGTIVIDPIGAVTGYFAEGSSMIALDGVRFPQVT